MADFTARMGLLSKMRRRTPAGGVGVACCIGREDQQ
jgi:hypothetical protein